MIMQYAYSTLRTPVLSVYFYAIMDIHTPKQTHIYFLSLASSLGLRSNYYNCRLLLQLLCYYYYCYFVEPGGYNIIT